MAVDAGGTSVVEVGVVIVVGALVVAVSTLGGSGVGVGWDAKVEGSGIVCVTVDVGRDMRAGPLVG